MPKARSRPLRFVALALATLSVGSCLGVREITSRFVFPIAESNGSSPLTPADGVEIVEYATSDGIGLRGARVHGADGAGGSVIVLFHGNGESAQGEVSFAEELAARFHVDVFVGEFRGYGGTRGSPSEAGLFRDGRAAVAATGRAPRDVVLVGWSLGSAVALELAHERLGRSVVLLAPFTSIDDTARALLHDPESSDTIRSFMGRFGVLVDPAKAALDGPFGSLLFPDHFDAVSKIATVRVPLFVVHGTEDRVVPYAQGAALAHAAPDGTLFTVEGVDHFVEGSREARQAIELALAVR